MLLLRTSGEKGWVSEGFFRGFAKAFFMGFSAWGIGGLGLVFKDSASWLAGLRGLGAGSAFGAYAVLGCSAA